MDTLDDDVADMEPAKAGVCIGGTGYLLIPPKTNTRI